MIDTHAHIDFENYKDNLPQIIDDANTNGINKIIIPGVVEENFDRIINIIEKYENIYGAIGIHPSEALSYNETIEKRIIELSRHEKIVAIGEIGLDYYWDKSFIAEQKEIFKSQIEIAKMAKKPIIVHDREAHEDTFNILKETNAKEVGVVMHCFSGSLEFAKQCVKEGFYIALGGVTTFKNAKKPKEIAKNIPLEYLLLETDSPYLTPVPYRGKENQPAYVRFVAEEIAALRGITIEEVDKMTTKNAIKLFNLEESDNG